jgi:hypothetical protein
MAGLDLVVIGNCTVTSCISPLGRHGWFCFTPAESALWGNYPQTCSQIGLILAAMRLSRSWEEGLWHA